MPDDEVRTPPDSRLAGQATPNRGKRREPPLIEGVAETMSQGTEPGAGERDPAELPSEPFATGSGPAEPPEPGLADATVQEPSMAAGAADLAAAERAAGPSSRSSARDFSETPDDRSLRQRRSRVPLLLSGLGLLLALLLGAVLYTLYNPPADEALAGLTNDVNALKQRVASLDAKPVQQPNLTPLQNRVAALEVRPAGGSDLKPLQDRIAALEAASGQLKSDLNDLRGKLETQAGTAASAQAAPTAPAPVDLGPLQTKLADLDSNLKSLQGTVASAPKVDLAPLDRRVDDLGQKLATVQSVVQALPHVDLGPVNGRLDELDRRLTPIEAQLAAPKVTAQVTEARQNGSAAETRAAPLAVTAQAILQAIDDGRPFAPAVAALQSLGTDEKTLVPLRAVADKGAPTRADLLAGFDDLKGRMTGAGTPVAAGGLLDRMVAGARGLVKVRPTGANPGQDPDALVSRIADALQRGDAPTALTEWQALPEDGKAASQAWAVRLRLRVDAENAARSIETDAIAALGTRQ